MITEVIPPTRGGTRWTIRAGDVSDVCNPDDAAQVRRAARTLNVSEDAIRQAIRNYYAPTLTVDPSMDFKVVRGADTEIVREQVRPAQLVPRFLAAKRVEWDDLNVLACVQIDLEQSATNFTVIENLTARSGADAGWSVRDRVFLLFAEEEGIPAREKAASSLVFNQTADSPYTRKVNIRPYFEPPAQAVMRIASTPLGAQVWKSMLADREQIQPDDPRVGEWLAMNGFGETRERYPHDLCPINPHPYEGRDPVVVLDGGIWCFRCDGRLGDGFRSWAQLIGGSTEPIVHPWVAAAREWVHWEHAKRVLPTFGLDPQTMQWAYSGIVRACHRKLKEAAPAEFEDLHRQVFNPHLLWVRGDSGQWLHAESLEPLVLKDPELACLPWVRGKRELIALARSPYPLKGFLPVRPVDTVLNPDSVPPGSVPIAVPRPKSWAPPPRSASIDPLPFDQAIGVLRNDFPGVVTEYLMLLLLANACSEAGGPPTILVTCGPSGAGKTQTIYLASSIIEGRPADVTDAISSTEETWRRRVGEAIASGCRPLVVNDLHRVKQLHQQIKLVISMEDPLEYRPLYCSALRTRLRSPLVMTCVTLPKALSAPEIARRIQIFRLPMRIAAGADWRDRGVKTSMWRNTPTDDEKLAGTPSREWIRARAAEGILAEVVRIAQANDYRWSQCAKLFGASSGESADPEQDEIDESLLRRLFEHVCGREGTRIMSKSARWPGSRGWVDLTSTDAQAILSELMPDLGSSVDPRHVLNQTLMEIDWPRVLGKKVGVRFAGNVRCQTWVGRFEGVGINGSRPINEELP